MTDVLEPAEALLPRPRRGAPTKAEQRQASMDLLLDAALRLFVSQGYRSTNLEQISGAANLTKGAVYFYFRSKEAVLVELLKRVQQVVVDMALTAVENAGPSPQDRLVAYIHYQAGLGITHRDEVLLLILMSLEFKERDGDVKIMINALYQRQRTLMDQLIEHGQRSGDFRSDVPLRELSTIVLAINDGTFLEWFRRTDQLDGKDLTRALRTTVLNGVMKRSEVPSTAAASGSKAVAVRKRARRAT